LAGEKGAHFGALCRGAQVRRRGLNLVHYVEEFGWGRKLARGYSAICYPGFTHPNKLIN
jgi:hypothetical protein